MENPIKITLGGTEYTLRASYEIVLEIQKSSGSRIMSLVKRFANDDVGLEDYEAVLKHSIVERPLPPDLPRLIYAAGLTKCAGPVMGLLLLIATGKAPPA